MPFVNKNGGYRPSQAKLTALIKHADATETIVIMRASSGRKLAHEFAVFLSISHPQIPAIIDVRHMTIETLPADRPFEGVSIQLRELGEGGLDFEAAIASTPVFVVEALKEV